MNDLEFGTMLVSRGVLTRDDLDGLLREALPGPGGGRRRLLLELVIEKGLVDPIRLDEILAGIQHRRRFCATCAKSVPAPRLTPDGERCGRCGDAVRWESVALAPANASGDDILKNAGEFPEDVRAALQVSGSRFGKYVLIEDVGRGGCGAVFRAWDLLLAQSVALKLVIEGNPGQDEEASSSLIKEARNAIRLRHPNIVTVYDVGIVEGKVYIAMEFIEGGSLAGQFRECRKNGFPSPLYRDPAKFLRLLADIADAVDYAHKIPRPVFHCDLKPANILTDPGGHPYVADFGLARGVDRERVPGKTSEHETSIAGTLGYLAPEQALPVRGGIGAWTDVYSLAAILYETLSGRPPFVGSSFDVLEKTVNEAPVPPLRVLAGLSAAAATIDASILEALQKIALKGLEKRPDRRLESAGAMAAALREIAARIPDAAPRPAGPALGTIVDSVRTLRFHDAVRRVSEIHAPTMTVDAARHVEELRRRLAVLQAFKARMIAKINADHPGIELFEVADREFDVVQLKSAGEDRISMVAGGAPIEVPWADIPDRQIVTLAVNGLGMTLPEDRLALGIYCLNSRFVARGREFLASLDGTALEDNAKSILDLPVIQM